MASDQYAEFRDQRVRILVRSSTREVLESRAQKFRGLVSKPALRCREGWDVRVR